MMDEASYRDAIAKTLTEINALATTHDSSLDYTDQLSLLVSKLAQLDNLFIQQNHGSAIKSQVLFSRHGKCSSKDKGLGASPNAGVNQTALDNMEITKSITSALLLGNTTVESNPTKEILYVEVSPLRRTLQTAERILPESVQCSVTVNCALAENSTSPSGMDINSMMQFNAYKQKARRAKNKAVFAAAAFLYASEETFHEVRQHKTAAIKHLEAKQGGRKINKVHDRPLSDELKVFLTQKSILDHSEHRNTWYVGHGRNFKELFCNTFGQHESLKYAETRRVFHLINNQLYCPPYRFEVDQKTGLITTSFYTKPFKLSPIADISGSTDAEAITEDQKELPQDSSTARAFSGLGCTEVVPRTLSDAFRESLALLELKSRDPVYQAKYLRVKQAIEAVSEADKEAYIMDITAECWDDVMYQLATRTSNKPIIHNGQVVKSANSHQLVVNEFKLQSDDPISFEEQCITQLIRAHNKNTNDSAGGDGPETKDENRLEETKIQHK